MSTIRKTTLSTIQKIGLACLCLATLACNGTQTQLMKRDETLNSYGGAIRWGAFERAADFQSRVDNAPLDMNILKDIHVTAYDPVFKKEQDEGKTVRQTVEIRYFHEQTGVEKTLTDHQIWRFDEEKDAWHLETPLPRFTP